MAKVVVLGISGGFGACMAQVFAERGWQVSGVCRQPDLVRQLPVGVQVFKGDIKDVESWCELLDKGDVLVYAVNPPYQQWREHALSYLECALKVAEEKQLTVLFPGNVYGFDPSQQSLFSEDDAQHAPDYKGEIRVQMEARLRDATTRGARAVVLRMGDFIDPFAGQNNWFNLLSGRSGKGCFFKSPGDPTIEHSWAYLPDAAATFERLARQAEQLPAYACFHYRGLVCSAQQLVQNIGTATNQKVQLRQMSWLPLHVIGWFSPIMREVISMRYLWDKPLVLDDKKLQEQLVDSGGVPATHLNKLLLELFSAKH